MKNALHRIVNVVKFLATRGLAFRGSEEKIGSQINENSLGIIELISQYDPFLAEHLVKYGNLGSGKTSYLCKIIYEKLVHLNGKEVFSFIIKEMKDRKYFSISVDSTPDVSHTDQLTVIVSYVLDSGPIERFLKFLPLTSHKCKDMADLEKTVLEKLNKSNIDVINCRGQSYNNTSNMGGTYKGMEAKIKKHCKYADYCPCASNSLNLIGKPAASCCIESDNFFSIINELYNFFSASTYRWEVMKDILDPLGLKVVKKLSETCSSARHDAVSALFDGYSHIKPALFHFAENSEQKIETRATAKRFLNKINNLDIQFYSAFGKPP